MTIHSYHFKKALGMIMKIGSTMDHAMRYIGAARIAEAREELINFIRRHPNGISHSKLLRAKHQLFANGQEFRDTLDILIESKIIVSVRDIAKGGAIHYKVMIKKGKSCN